MASMTLEIVVEKLKNEELDEVEKKYWQFLKEDRPTLPGKVTDCSEVDREEDEEED